MISGCIHNKKVDQGNGTKIGFCQLRTNYEGRSLKCEGTLHEKKTCPEWGIVLAAENYCKMLGNDNRE